MSDEQKRPLEWVDELRHAFAPSAVRHAEQINISVIKRIQNAALERAAQLASTYDNGQFTTKDTWAEGFKFAKRMIATNIRNLKEPT